MLVFGISALSEKIPEEYRFANPNNEGERGGLNLYQLPLNTAAAPAHTLW